MNVLLRYKFILIAIAVVIAGAVWYGLSSSPTTPDLTSAPTSSSSVEQGIVPVLLTLRAVKLDGMIFSNPTFIRLKDFSIEIVPEPVGRTNPFAPLGSPNRMTTSTSASL